MSPMPGAGPAHTACIILHSVSLYINQKKLLYIRVSQNTRKK